MGEDQALPWGVITAEDVRTRPHTAWGWVLRFLEEAEGEQVVIAPDGDGGFLMRVITD